MRSWQKKGLLNVLYTIQEAQNEIIHDVQKEEFITACQLTEECQESAIQLGNLIESSEGENFITVLYLEAYCESLYCIYDMLSQNNICNLPQEFRKLQDLWKQIDNSIKNDIPIRIEMAFLPYKAAMWDSMESIWRAAQEDKDCDAVVVPIPYFERTTDGRYGTLHYEGSKYPEDVPVLSWKEYDLVKHRPDVVFIHNPYDDCNRVTSVAPQFYSSELKKYTDMLIYVPYFLFPGKAAQHLIDVPAVYQADYICVQNEAIKKSYVDVIQEGTGEKAEDIEKRIWPIGSPKTDRVIECKNTVTLSNIEHNKKNKKVVFFNTNVSLILQNSYLFIENMRRIFSIFEKYKNEFFVIWREHPLSESTIKSMRPEMLDDYRTLKAEFMKNGIGMIDQETEPYQAMCASDCYFGSGGSLIPIYSLLGNPMLVTAYTYPDGISKQEITLDDFIRSSGSRTYYNEKNANSLDLFLSHLVQLDALREKRIALMKKISNNLDGTVGSQIYNMTKSKFMEGK